MGLGPKLGGLSSLLPEFPVTNPSAKLGVILDPAKYLFRIPDQVWNNFPLFKT